MKNRLKKEVRKEQIIDAALDLAASGHYKMVTRDALAKACNVSGPSIQYHFHTMTQLRTAIVKAAIKTDNKKILLQAVSMDDPLVKGKYSGAELITGEPL